MIVPLLLAPACTSITIYGMYPFSRIETRNGSVPLAYHYYPPRNDPRHNDQTTFHAFHREYDFMQRLARGYRIRLAGEQGTHTHRSSARR